MIYKVCEFKNLFLTLIMFFVFDICAQTGSSMPTKPVQQIPSLNKSAESLTTSKDLLEIAKDNPHLYNPKLMESHAVAEDGFPIANSRFEFSKNELQNLNEIDVVKNVLKREQRKLTREYFEKNILFNHLPVALLEKYISETSKTIDDAIDAHTEFKTLNYFNFDTYRAHLYRVGMFKLYTGQAQTSGQIQVTPSTQFSINHLIPKTPFEIIAVVSLLLNFIVLGYFIKSKYS
jgi:hypothetical protein